MQRTRLAPDYEISRVVRGGWQMASGHGAASSDDPVADMIAFADAGITTFDCADIYTGVEELIGRFRLRYREERGQEALDRIKVHTKFSTWIQSNISNIGLIYFSPPLSFLCAPIAKSEAWESSLTSPLPLP